MTREDDKRVAEIMGWRDIRHSGEIEVINGEVYGLLVGYRSKSAALEALPRFTSDPAADYTVLEYMRREYRDSEDASKVEVWELYYDEVPGEICDYEPGIFSMTALELDKKGVLK